jgi:hypothetical protein
VEGYRLRGRPRSRWKDNINKDVELMGINPEEGKQAALERGEWAAAVTQAYGPYLWSLKAAAKDK